MSMQSLSKHGNPLTKKPKLISLWQSANYTRIWDDFPCMIICLHREVVSQCLCEPLFTLGEKQSDLAQSQSPPSPLCVSLIRVTPDSWVKPTWLTGIGLQFYHSFPFNAVEQQMAALFTHQTPPHGLLEQEGNVGGQIKSGVGLSAAWVTAPPLPP